MSFRKLDSDMLTHPEPPVRLDELLRAKTNEILYAIAEKKRRDRLHAAMRIGSR